MPVVLLHGSASSGAQWRALAGRLGPRHRVLAPDLYGYGASASWCGRGAFQLRHEADPVLAQIEQLGEPVHLVGHSYGGTVALSIARRYGALVRSLTLIEPVAFHLLRHGDAADAAALAEIRGVAAQMERALARGDYEDGCNKFVDYWNGVGTWDRMPAVRRDALVLRLAKIVLDFHATINEDVAPADLRSLTVPTLLLQGAATVPPIRRICRLVAGALPAARFESVAGAGHMLPLTHCDEVNALIAAHIDAIQSREVTDGNEEHHPDFTRADHGRLRGHAAA